MVLFTELLERSLYLQPDPSSWGEDPTWQNMIIDPTSLTPISTELFFASPGQKEPSQTTTISISIKTALSIEDLPECQAPYYAPPMH